MPLNDTLYQLLEEEFGHVEISHAGEAMQAHYVCDPRSGKAKLEVDHPGEYYRVSCPFCDDTRHRLWINHRWGVLDPVSSDRNLWLACCYNEQCLVKGPWLYWELYTRVYGFKNANLRGRRVEIEPVVDEAPTLLPVALPGTCVRLDELPPDHPAVTYLRTRGYDPAQLARDHGVAFCCEAPRPYGLAAGRIVIPIRMGGELVGWQCRHVGDIDQKTTGLPKYYTMPRMPKRSLLYNFDVARHFPFTVLCEGTSDVWRVGKPAIALLGKSLSQEQARLISSAWGQGAVVLLFDGDEAGLEATVDVHQALKDRVKHLVPIQLPNSLDPGVCSTEYLWSMIEGAARAFQVDLHAAA